MSGGVPGKCDEPARCGSLFSLGAPCDAWDTVSRSGVQPGFSLRDAGEHLATWLRGKEFGFRWPRVPVAARAARKRGSCGSLDSVPRARNGICCIHIARCGARYAVCGGPELAAGPGGRVCFSQQEFSVGGGLGRKLRAGICSVEGEDKSTRPGVRDHADADRKGGYIFGRETV